MFKKGKEKAGKPTKTGGKLFATKKPRKPVKEGDIDVASVEQYEESLAGHSTKKPSKPKGGLDLKNFEVSKLDIKKVIMGLVAVLVVLLLLLLAKIFMGGNDTQNQAQADVVVTEQPVASEPEPSVPDAVLEQPPEPNPSSVPAETPVSDPVVEQPMAVMDTPAAPAVTQPEVPAQTPVSTPQDNIPPATTESKPKEIAVPAPSGGKMTYEEFIKETENRVYRERNTAPPTATQ